MSMATKLDRLVTYNEELQLITWSCKDTSQIKYVIFLLPQGL